jgi:hypothetical protein
VGAVGQWWRTVAVSVNVIWGRSGQYAQGVGEDQAGSGGYRAGTASLVAAMLDRVLRALCPHDPASWQTAPDARGEVLMTCPACGVSWYGAS